MERIIKVYSNLCTKGYYLEEEDQVCIECAPGTHTYSEMQTSCEPCIQHLNCPGTGKTFPKTGYVRIHDESSLMIRCFNREACIEDDKNELRNCATGYEGEMCASCQLGFWKNPGTFKCYECSETDSFMQSMYKALLLVFFLVIACIIFYVFWSTKADPNVEIVAIIRILISFFHIMTILTRALGLETVQGAGQHLQQRMDYLSTYMSPAFWLTDTQCTEYSTDDKGEDLRLTLLITVAIIPALILLLWALLGLV